MTTKDFSTKSVLFSIEGSTLLISTFYLFFTKRFAERQSHGSSEEDKAGTETESDKNATVYYHRIGTPQCASLFYESLVGAHLRNPITTIIQPKMSLY